MSLKRRIPKKKLGMETLLGMIAISNLPSKTELCYASQSLRTYTANASLVTTWSDQSGLLFTRASHRTVRSGNNL
ncbi:hypothetical protein PDE_06182 [Penicillium oxalicum 114-2]|uniref:Uncharacterized protein n=1 Tax=Penicillium oxalicum (strain 114-2 / CGMCC 5302) TaxID=933388 RepID=S8B8Z2_PENO1|nr:hypothetical protein PDE_06182 [Penicillium oxalicum 114-2]